MDAVDGWLELLSPRSDGAAAYELLAALVPVFAVGEAELEASGEAERRAGRTTRDVSTWPLANGPMDLPELNTDKRESAEQAAKLERQRALSAKRKRAHRERAKLEVEELTAQVAALEEELRASRDARGLSGADSSQRTLCEVWRELATRHQERRRSAERLNEQLKRKIARNGALLRDLSQLPAAPCSSHCEGLGSQFGSPRGDLFDKSLLVGFARELDVIYAHTDEAMLRPGCFTREPEELWRHSVTHRCDPATGGEMFEIVDSFVLPFAYSKASPALWQSMAKIYATDPELLVAEAIEHPAQTIAVHYRMYGNEQNSSFMSCSFVIRQYVESDRTVLVWRALSEGQEGSTAGVATDETGWSVLHAIPSDCCFSVDGQGGTVMNTFVQMHPLVSDSAKRRESVRALDFEAFVSKVISSVSEDGDAIARLMDGLLLTDASA